MAQTLLLGLGGTGSRIVNYVASDLNKKRIPINDGNICCAVLDTNDNDRDKLVDGGSVIPVIATSKDRKIADYIKLYNNRGVREWMPESPSLLKENMKDGASQMRVKSRLAFLDTAETKESIHELEVAINELFNYRDGKEIRVMLVSSLAGGTGAGMFIQTALWLRKFFDKKKCPITIRGILVLPDVFIDTLDDIRNDENETQSLYANAYAAIRELNAITKIKTKGMKTFLPVTIDNLFDSEKDVSDGQPVFDFAFFVDNITEGGSGLKELEQYERVISRLVYMQLYAPMHDDLYSEEDNLFKRYEKSPEPLFGSCGTAKAKYPTEDILRYCALRASQDALSNGWRKLDDEILAKQKREEEREKNGTVITERINPRYEYVRLFDAKAALTGKEVGNDRLFTKIGKDVKNESRDENLDGKIEVSYTDKVEDFMTLVDEAVEKAVDNADSGNLADFRLAKSWLDRTTDTRATLLNTVNSKERAITQALEDIDKATETLAEDVLDLIFPADMGDINQDNAASVYGLFTKKNSDDQTVFIHPVAARYLIYKLSTEFSSLKDDILLDKPRTAAEKGYGEGKPKIKFDNPATGKTEDSPKAFLESNGFLQNEKKFIKIFKNLYYQHITGQAELCRSYAILAVKYRLAVLFGQRLKALIDGVEDFFKKLPKVSNTLAKAIGENVEKNETLEHKVIYVCATEKEKEALYKSIGLDTAGSEAGINGVVVKALYGQFCASERPDAENNKDYVGKSLENAFYRDVIATYTDILKKRHKDDIDLDIYSAICKCSDIEYEAKQQAIKDNESDNPFLDVDTETDESNDTAATQRRYLLAMEAMKKRLMDTAAPFLVTSEEFPDDEDEDEHLSSDVVDEEPEDFIPTRKRKTFWGFNPVVAQNCSALGTILGINVAQQQNIAYSKNELDCYRAVYGIAAQYVDKFNELKDGEYYASYCNVVKDMVKEVGDGHEEALVHTPHLDKTWHLYLPYITPEKQADEDKKFYRYFWFAIAYGLITVNKYGNFQMLRTKHNAHGEFLKNETIKYDGKPIGRADFDLLLTALKIDGEFMAYGKRLEGRFLKECANIGSGSNYEDTELLRGHKASAVEEYDENGELIVAEDKKADKLHVGGLGSSDELNAVSIIVRYHNSPKPKDDIEAALVKSLENLFIELVGHKFGDTDEEKAKARTKGYMLCKRVYDSSDRKDKDIELIRHWKDAKSNNIYEG